MKLKEVLDKTTLFFKDKKFESPRLDAELLLSNCLGFQNRVDLYLKFDTPLKEQELNDCREAVKRRAQGEPVAYITGKKGFFGYDFFVNADVLIPRPETELLVEEALQHAEQCLQEQDSIRIMDMGCGSGCIGLSLYKTLLKSVNESKTKKIQLYSIDKSTGALEVAKRNAEQLGLENVQFMQFDLNDQTTDLLPDLAGTFDIVLANPPYVKLESPDLEDNVKKYEPHDALFADDNGLLSIKKWSQRAQGLLKDQGLVVFEMGHDQSEDVQKFFTDIGYKQVRLIKDLAGINRHVSARKET